MKKARILALVLAAILALSLLAGCEGPQTATEAPADATTAAQTKTGKTEGVVIGLSMNTTTNAWRAGLVAKAQETADAAVQS